VRLGCLSITVLSPKLSRRFSRDHVRRPLDELRTPQGFLMRYHSVTVSTRIYRELFEYINPLDRYASGIIRGLH